MNYDRKEVKLVAKALVRDTRPRPMWVTFAYMMLVSLISFVLMMVCMIPYFTFLFQLATDRLTPGSAMVFAGGLPILFVFVYVLVLLYAMVMQYGYYKYVLAVKRQQPSGVRDLFSGFSRVGRVLMLNLLLLVFTVLWSLLGGVVYGLLIGIGAIIGSDVVNTIFSFVGYLALLAFLMNRILRYSLAFFVMVDHPELTAREALNESKAIMKGNIWRLFVLEISFFGWFLLCAVILYAVLLPGTGIIVATLSHNPVAAMVAFFVLFIVAFLAAALLGMWVNAYQSVALAGFYDAVNGFGGPAAPVEEVTPSIPTFIPPVMEPTTPVAEEPVPVAEPEPPAEPESAPEDSTDASGADDAPEI